LIFISYRYWLPVPCAWGCAAGEECTFVVCAPESATDASATCTPGQPNECPARPTGQTYTCDSGSCDLRCTPGQLTDVCMPAVPCANACESFVVDSISGVGACLVEPDTCVCNGTDLESCDPAAPINTCGPGTYCGNGCLCEPVPGCFAGIAGNGAITDCNAALTCCDSWAGSQTTCAAIIDSATCTAAPDCQADTDGSCIFKYPTCCGPGEAPQCISNLETGEVVLHCVVGQCVCDPGCTPNELCEPVPGGGCGCFLNPG